MFHYYLLFLQIRVRVLEDVTNKIDEQAVELTKALKFIRDTINAPIVDDHSLLIIYDYAYVHAKYVNKNVNMSGFNETEKKLSKKAQADPWGYAMERVAIDSQQKREYTEIKERVGVILRGVSGFELKE